MSHLKKKLVLESQPFTFYLFIYLFIEVSNLFIHVTPKSLKSYNKNNLNLFTSKIDIIRDEKSKM